MRDLACRRGAAGRRATTERHAERLAAFVDSLGLRDLTLFLTDWGSPIGLALAGQRRLPLPVVQRLHVELDWATPHQASQLFCERRDAEGDGLQSIWSQRAAFVNKPALVLWGARDIAFRRKELDTWLSELSQCELHEYTDCGHFLAEEAPDEVLQRLRAFLHRA